VTFEPWQWAVAIVGGVIVGVSKTGVPGLGILSVALFAQIMPAKESTGLVLPLLIFADVISVSFYRRHAQWAHLWRLLPWATAGVVAGYVTMGKIDDSQARLLIGIVLVALVGAQFARRLRSRASEPEHGWWFAPLVGILLGFTTLVSNAAGPLMATYLVAMGLPKMEFAGTAAVFFFILNLIIKTPFMVQLGLITEPSLVVNLMLTPAVLAGALLGRLILVRINQALFEYISLGLAAAAGIRLLMV